MEIEDVTDDAFWIAVNRCLKGLVAAINQMRKRARARGLKEKGKGEE